MRAREPGGALVSFAALVVTTAVVIGYVAIPFIVTATQIGVLTGLIDGVTAAAMVCAGLLSVILFPVAALALLSLVAVNGVTSAHANEGG